MNQRKINPFEAKRIAKREYANRQIDKFVKWSWEAKGNIKSTDIEQLHKRYGIICLEKTIINNEEY